ncbi:S-layer homology domain-containing protein [Brassicibacter mesophilus]|uniref:S-layer homology domain-containing protein n=1 Tax=Brassicibacter mesophilus TaxID=745119 RepID=UPI003D21C107
MKKKIIFLLLISLTAVLFTGCMEFEMGMKINKDNTGNMNLLFAYDEELLGEYIGAEENPVEELMDIGDVAKTEGVEVIQKDLEYTKNDALYKGKSVDFKFDDMKVLYNEMENDEFIIITDLGEGVCRVDVNFKVDEKATASEADSGNMEDLFTKELFKELGGRTEFIFETEYEVKNHNADYITEDGKYVWDLYDAISGTKDKSVFVEFYTGQEVFNDSVSSVSELFSNRQELEASIKLDVTNKDFHGKALQAIGILQGTEKGLELDKQLTRIEGAAMYARLLGLEDEIKEFKISNPEYSTGFNDVPKWAEPTINYLHYKGLVNGISNDKYGSKDNMTEQQFTTLVLRALGYDDSSGEFKWNSASAKALKVGLYANDAVQYNSVVSPQLTRRGMSYISYNALFFEHKLTGKLLINNLKH